MIPGLSAINPKLYPHQREGVREWLRKRRMLFAWEMTVGKSPLAVECARLSKAQHILIVCPALMRRVWARELDTWWSGHPLVSIIEPGCKSATVPAPITITSYAMVVHVVRSPWDLIIIDESHHIKESRSGRSQHVAAIVSANQHCGIIELSGTPITIEPQDLWHQLYLLDPKRWQSYYAYCNTWCGRVVNEYSPKGYDWVGLMPGKASQLHHAIAPYVSRVTKAVVADKLPPLIVERLPISVDDTTSPAKILKSKLAALSELWDDRIKDKVCILTYLRESARTVETTLQTARPIIRVDGSYTTPRRDKLLSQARSTDRAVLIATMDSIAEGISLTDFSLVYFLELYASPRLLTQVAARFHRLGHKGLPVTVRFLIADGTGEEFVVDRLTRRVEELAALGLRGQTVDKVAEALTWDIPRDTILAKLQAKIANSTEEEIPF